MRRLAPTLLLALCLHAGPALWAGSAAAAEPTQTPQQSGTEQRLQAISPVDEQIAWASGTGGTVVVTRDGGATWQTGVVPGAEGLEFRDVQGISDQVAYLLSAGKGSASRIYRTADGGKNWALQFTNAEELAFYDCFAFWDPSRALAMSDSVNGIFPVLRTSDGQNWKPIGAQLPRAADGEGAFASSGTCVATHGADRAWIATGAGPASRVLATADGGETWTAHATPIVQGSATAGAFTIAFRDAEHGFLGGGNLAEKDGFSDNTATSSDGGKSWTLRTRSPFPGAIYGSSYVTGSSPRLVITGPGGAAWSADEGTTWQLLEGVKEYWAVAFTRTGTGWLVGTQGKILKIGFAADPG